MGFVVLVIGLSMGFNSGYAVNPARDLGPRLFTAIAGWGSEVFTSVDRFELLFLHIAFTVIPTNTYYSVILSLSRVRQGWFLVPVFAPFLGTFIGVMIYQLMVGFHMEGEVRDRKESTEQETVRLTNVTSKDNSREAVKERNEC